MLGRQHVSLCGIEINPQQSLLGRQFQHLNHSDPQQDQVSLIRSVSHGDGRKESFGSIQSSTLS